MGGEKLRIEQGEPAADHPRHQMHQRHFAGVALARKHAFAEEGAAQFHAIKPANQFAVAPAFNRMGVACRMKRNVKTQDLVIDPAFSARSGVGSAQARITSANADIRRYRETVAPSPCARAVRGRWKPSSGMIPRRSGDTQNSSSLPRRSAMGNIPSA